MVAIIECFEIGMHMLIPLDLIGLLLGAGVQLLLCFKAKKTVTRGIFVSILVVGLVASEIATACMTGYDRFVPMFAYWFFFMLLVGALVCMLVFWIIHKKRS